MRFLKRISFFILLIQSTTFFSQNTRGTSPSPQNLPPEANFSWSNSCYGDTTCFINQTIRGVTYTWTVTEDTTIGIAPPSKKTLLVSNDTNICFHFWKPGTYTVSLDAFNNHPANSTQVITIDTITKADFSFVHCSNAFANKSTCASTFLWDFGDGNHSTIISPIHQYADTGHYVITLIAKKGTISDTSKKIIFVDVESFANTNYTKTISHDTLFVHITTMSSVSNYYWSFGDGINGTKLDTFHVYKDSAAIYSLGLVVVNSCGPAFKSDTVKIVLPPVDTLPKPPSRLDFSNSILTIVPNPAADDYVTAFFNAYAPNKYLSQVYNSLGQKVFEEYFVFDFGINGFKISTANFSTGVYVMTLQSGNSYIRTKFYIINKSN